MPKSLARLARIASILLLAWPLLTGATGITAVPPAAFVPPPQPKAAAQPRPIIASPERRIALGAPPAAQLAKMKASNANPKGVITKRGVAIGFARDIATADRTIAGDQLRWTAVEDGFAARIDVVSTSAAAVRIALAAEAGDPDVSVRVSGATPEAPIYGPYPLNRVAQVTAEDGVFWTPVIEGDTAVIELHASAGVALENVHLSLVRVSHLAVAGADLQGLGEKVLDIGTSSSCEVDVKCVANPPQALLDLAKSVAKMLFTDPDGTSYLCTGTLLNDSIASFTPYFYTASHCIDSQARATTLNTYWFFDAATCNSRTVPPYVLLTGGAMLLGRSEDYDWSLLRLRDTPPAGATFAAWRAEPVSTGAPVFTMHHPEGDLKKWSQGTAQGYRTYNDGSTFEQVRWTVGSTEPGSSGAGLFTFPGGAFYELRGGLYGGEASCSNRTGVDVFSRLDKAAPYLRQYLTPNVANPNGEVVVVEYYHAGLDHYFITAYPDEIAVLDSGQIQGWVRTGLRFLAYGDPARASVATTPVCRYYLTPAVGNSHFYSADPTECATLGSQFAGVWIAESPNVFYAVLPDGSGACASGMLPVYRFFRPSTNNHRYTMEEDVRQLLASTPGWIAEGAGNGVVFCSPQN